MQVWSQSPDRSESNKVLNWLSALLLTDGLFNNIVESHEVDFVKALNSGEPNWIQVENDRSVCIKVAEVFRPLMIDLVARWAIPEAPIQIFSYLSNGLGEDVVKERIWAECVAYTTGLLISSFPQIKR